MLQECFKHPNTVCTLQECFKHPNNVSVCCKNASNTPIMSGVYVCCRNASNTLKLVSVCCRNASNTPIMSAVCVCCRNASNTPILSVHCRNASNTPILVSVCCRNASGLLRTYILGYARTTPPHWLPSHHPLYLVSNTKITLLSHHYKHYHKHKLLHHDNSHFIMSALFRNGHTYY